MTVDTIKVLGERNTGTNFLEELLAENTSLSVIDNNVSPRYMRLIGTLRRRLSPTTFHRVSEPLRDVIFRWFLPGQHGWKHAAVTEGYLASLPAGLAVIAVTKDPYAWLVSLHRHPYHRAPGVGSAGETFSDFIRRPWTTVRREQCARTYPDPVALWNAKMLSYRRLNDREHAVVVRYEDLIGDVPGTLRAISATCGFALGSEIVVPERSSKADDRSTAAIIEHYRERRFLAGFTAEDLAFVNERLDADALAVGPYEMVETLGGHQG